MSFNKNNTSTASDASANSKYSNNKFAPLFNPANKIYNKSTVSDSSLFIPKDNKNKNRKKKIIKVYIIYTNNIL